MEKGFSYTTLPSINARLVAKYLTEHGIENQLLSEIEMVDEDISPSCVYRGKYFDDRILCIKAKISQEEIYEIDKRTRRTKLR